jgi:hypothetical protein
MHDGVFRTRDLTTEERRLAETVDHYDCHTDQDRRDAVRNLLVKRCRLPRWLLPEAIPNDLFARDDLLRRIERESDSPFVDAVGAALEQVHWDPVSYPQALEEAVSKALNTELDAVSRRLMANVSDEKPQAAGRAILRLREATEGFAAEDVVPLASEVAQRGRVGTRKQGLDVDGEIPGVNYSAA